MKSLIEEIREARDAAQAEVRETNKTLIQMRFDAAKAIPDPKQRAEALNAILAEMGDIQAQQIEVISKKVSVEQASKRRRL